jgi:hypothetical protein
MSEKMTLQEIADVTGASYSTVAKYAQNAGWTKNGVHTLLDEKQVTAIVEAMKFPVSSGTKSNLLSELEGTETSESRALRIELLYRQIDIERQAEIKGLKSAMSQAVQLLDWKSQEEEVATQDSDDLRRYVLLYADDLTTLLDAYKRVTGKEYPLQQLRSIVEYKK